MKWVGLKRKYQASSYTYIPCDVIIPPTPAPPMLISYQIGRPVKIYETMVTSEATITTRKRSASAKSTLYVSVKLSNTTAVKSADFMDMRSEVQWKIEKLKN